MFELKEFVKEALSNIVEGVKLANNEHSDRFQISGGYHQRKGINGEFVEFDILVVTQDTAKADAKGKLGIFVFSGQIGGSKESHQEYANRIKFKIFVTEK